MSQRTPPPPRDGDASAKIGQTPRVLPGDFFWGGGRIPVFKLDSQNSRTNSKC